MECFLSKIEKDLPLATSFRFCGRRFQTLGRLNKGNLERKVIRTGGM